MQSVQIKSDKGTFFIRALNADDSYEEITHLLHKAYKPLAEMGLRFVATYQDVAMTKERCLEGKTFVLTDDSERICGTITMYAPENDSACNYYKRNDVWKFGQFAVLPELQKMGFGGRLMDYVEKEAKSIGAKELALDTSENATHLIEYYTKRGYEFREFVQWDVTNYRSVILSKKL